MINQLQFEQEIGKIYTNQFDCTFRLLRDIDFAQGNILNMLYQKKVEDLNEDLLLADIVAKEYRSGGKVR